MKALPIIVALLFVMAAPIMLTKITKKVDLPNLFPDFNMEPCLIFIEDLLFPLYHSDCSDYSENETVRHTYDPYYMLHSIDKIGS